MCSESSPAIRLELIRPAAVNENVSRLCRVAGVESDTDGPTAAVYAEALNRLQQHLLPKSDLTPRLGFGDSELERTLLRELMTVPRLANGWQYQNEERSQIGDSVAAALETLDTVDDELAASITTLVPILVFGKQQGLHGGSVSHLAGAVWLAPKPEWTILDYAENLAHEYVHQVLFLDEMVNTLFTAFDIAELSVPEALVTSTVLKRRRPYDKAFHSAFVGYVILQLRLALDSSWVSSNGSGLYESLVLTVSELAERQQFLTPNGRARLAELDRELPGLSVGAVA